MSIIDENLKLQFDGESKRAEMLYCGYWVNKLITFPPMDLSGMQEEDQELAHLLKTFISKKVLIKGINNLDTDPVDEIYVLVEFDGKGNEVPFNFGDYYPIEIAEAMGVAGYGHFGEEIPIEKHPHFNKLYE